MPDKTIENLVNLLYIYAPLTFVDSSFYRDDIQYYIIIIMRYFTDRTVLHNYINFN